MMPPEFSLALFMAGLAVAGVVMITYGVVLLGVIATVFGVVSVAAILIRG